MSAALDTFIAFALLALIFVPLERVFAARPQRLLRDEWGIDLCFFLGQYLLWTAPVVAAMTWFAGQIEHWPLAALRATVRAWPFWVQFLVAIALSDAAIYWAHRLQHRHAFLWRFHRVHHTAPAIDWLAAHREHPLDNLYTRGIENLPLILLGFPLHHVAGFAVFRGLWAIFIHSNVALTPGPLRYVLGAPRLHHWHHAVERGGAVNFANLSPLMDLLFGTYYDPGHFPQRYGVAERLPHGWFAQMLQPFRGLWPRRWMPARAASEVEAPRAASSR